MSCDRCGSPCKGRHCRTCEQDLDHGIDEPDQPNYRWAKINEEEKEEDDDE